MSKSIATLNDISLVLLMSDPGGGCHWDVEAAGQRGRDTAVSLGGRTKQVSRTHLAITTIVTPCYYDH